jgi:hypothetical protein
MQRQSHWDAVYRTRGEEQLSWFEALPSLSLRMMEAAGLTPETCVLDVGGGDSRLVDVLAARGLDCLAVLDVHTTPWGTTQSFQYCRFRRIH